MSGWLWTIDQRRTLIVLLSCAIVCLAIKARHERQFMPDTLPAIGPRAGELQTKLDLNTVDAKTLGAIPRLGESKAAAIVDYRNKFEAAHPGHIAFEKVEDLLRIKGIGVGTVANLRPYVTIATTAPTSRP